MATYDIEIEHHTETPHEWWSWTVERIGADGLRDHVAAGVSWRSEAEAKLCAQAIVAIVQDGAS